MIQDIFLEENSRLVALKLPEFIIISGFTYFIFAFWVPHLSAIGMWYGISAFFTVFYIAISMIISIKDGMDMNSNFHFSFNVCLSFQLCSLR